MQYYKKAIVTGANGFIGKQLVSALLSKNIEVVAVAPRFDEILLNDNRIVCLNCKDKTPFDLEEALKDFNADVLFHLAWSGVSGSIRADYNIQLDNVRLACDYAALAAKINCKRFIYASSIVEMETYEYLQSDDANPTGGYIYGAGKLAAHLMAETVAKQAGIDFIPVIITNIYGVGEKSARLINTSIRKLLNGEHCSFTEGKQTYDFIYITDAIASIVEVAEKGKAFSRYYIGSGSPKPLKEFLLEMKDVVAPNAVLGLGDLPFNGIDIDYAQFKLKKVEQDTGYKNKVSFRDGIKMTMDFIKSER
ncbi:MAG: NAD(P)-dependent oxidoreductase [Clostridiales bacterium]|nr:NAD(P)-dependent oxidoreductase [Clostridiales bacterium]